MEQYKILFQTSEFYFISFESFKITAWAAMTSLPLKVLLNNSDILSIFNKSYSFPFSTLIPCFIFLKTLFINFSIPYFWF